MEKPMKFPQKFSEIDKINYLQRKIILNSVMYYVYNKSFVSDKYFGDISHQLVEMQKSLENTGKSPRTSTEYGYMMYDFDGSTGFDLYSRLSSRDRDKINQMCEYKLSREISWEKTRKKRWSKT